MAAQLLVVEELWRIYTFYTLHGDPLDPEHLRSTQLIKMLSKDCGLVTRGAGELLEADIFNAYQAEVTRSDKIAPGDARPHSALKMSLVGRPKGPLTDRKKVRAGRPAPARPRRPLFNALTRRQALQHARARTPRIASHAHLSLPTLAPLSRSHTPDEL